MYKVNLTHDFIKQFKKLNQKNRQLVKSINKSISMLKLNPYYPGLRTHVIDKDDYYGNVWSSRVTGDIRIIWSFATGQHQSLVLFKIGGHDFVY